MISISALHDAYSALQPAFSSSWTFPAGEFNSRMFRHAMTWKHATEESNGYIVDLKIFTLVPVCLPFKRPPDADCTLWILLWSLRTHLKALDNMSSALNTLFFIFLFFWWVCFFFWLIILLRHAACGMGYGFDMVVAIRAITSGP